MHSLFHRIHKLVFHGLKSELNPGAGCNLCKCADILDKTPFRFLTVRLVIDVIARNHHDPDAQICRQVNGPLRNLHSSGADRRIRIPEGVFGQGAGIERMNRHVQIKTQIYQFPTLLLRAVDTGDPLLRGVDADLHEVIPRLFCDLQLFLPGDIRHGLLIQAERIGLSHHASSSIIACISDQSPSRQSMVLQYSLYFLS